ncbi:MAG: calcium-dependent protein kinase [Caulobacteraceae bacterium]|nr:calcium-dependent protein kinase [Caulobacteraceae bacterium]
MNMARRPDPSLYKAIEEADRRWDRGNPSWFELLADDAVVYAINQSQPFVGRSAYQEHFRPLLTGAKRKTTALHRSIQVLEDSAVVAQTIQVVQTGVIANIRHSVIWSRAEDSPLGWQIRHLHSALIGSPSAVKMPSTAGAIRVLNERIATIAAVVGVAQ